MAVFDMYAPLFCSQVSYTMTTEGTTISTFTFQEYGVEIKFDRNPYLVDIVSEKIGSVMKLDSINDGKNWHRDCLML
ncbi:hypothetical protein Bca52824_025347 [Brassica carinata]|uniref:Uncharacterized protein n=1 Tax=Brassica carinata TaxID=52824 RepID=A0A8X7SEC5_BRACI|nr:hypothetical protein Bca52824_025347 [Brassica carinata]